ncbi:radical SAM protein [bacterium]|nr:radical SAM protein [bacterium]
MNRVLLIEPEAPGLHIFSAFPLPRLGTIMLATLARQQGWDAEVVVEETEEVPWDEITTYDLIGISTITSTAPRAYAMADRVREFGIPVVMGGPHVSFLPYEALEHSDYVMRGEGEIAWPMFLEAVEGHRAFHEVPSLTYQTSEGILETPDAAPILDLDTLPYPDFSLVRGDPMSVLGKRIIPMQASRGCPFDCSFCSVTGMFGRRYRHRSTEHILGELRQYNDKKNFLFFYDDNFAASPKKAKELMRAMAAEKFRFEWSTQVRADLARDPEMIQLMKEAGCHTVFIGFESVNPETLQEVKKRHTVEDMRESANEFRRHGIHVHGMFVLGLDGDNMASVRSTVQFALKTHMSTAQFMILTPLPGTRVYNELKASDRISFSDYSLYDAHHVVFEPKNFTKEELQKAQVWAHRHFYGWRATLRQLFRFNLTAVGVAHYARGLNRAWKRRNRVYLKLLHLLRKGGDLKIQADVKQLIRLQGRRGKKFFGKKRAMAAHM